MKNLKTLLFALIIAFGASFTLTSCEEEEVLPGTGGIEVKGSGDGGGMEDDEQWD